MVLAATTVAIIERRFNVAAAWLAAASLLSMTGLMHGYRFTPGDTAITLGPAWPWAIGYAAMAAVMLAATWLTEPDDEATGH